MRNAHLYPHWLQIIIEGEMDGKTIVVDYNQGILPTAEQVDLIISYFQELKNKGITNDFIYQHNEETFIENVKIAESYSEKTSQKKKKEKQTGWIYLIKSKKLYKIGRSKKINSRIELYRTENPHGIKVIAKVQVDDYKKIECELLKKYQDKKYRGEWFNLTEQDAQNIKNYLERKSL